MKDAWRYAAIAAVALAASAGFGAYVAFVPAEDTGPRDARGWILEARSRMQADRFAAAAEAYEKGLAASRKVAGDPQVWCELADALGMAGGGSLAGRPREIVSRALALKADHPRALEMAGSAAYEAGEDRLALEYWEPLLAQLAPGTASHAELEAAIARTRARMATR